MGLWSWITRRGNWRSDKPPECDAETVRCLEDAQLGEEGFDARDRGLRTVPLARIVGSVGRYQDFDARFRLRPSERLSHIKQAMRQGKPLPPVRLYQVRDAYYVLDGNHRIAAAKELGHDDILAHIVELVPSEDNLNDLIFRERAEFADQTGLSTEIRLTEVGQYAHLLSQIGRHQRHLAAGEKPDVDFKTAAADWYRTIYRPLCRIIQQAGLMEGFPDRRISDLYAYISHHLWEEERPRHYGPQIDQSIPKDMEAFRTMIAQRRHADQYPEMKRTITAFVLLNVQGKHEFKIMEKLFELDEVVEIHSVHGDIDLLAKIVLSRDLLASDAEVISQFVTEKIRLVPGVNSSKTLIPGTSKVKPIPEEV
jgi:DNA-binding Lrp family transcriptional regulator